MQIQLSSDFSYIRINLDAGNLDQQAIAQILEEFPNTNEIILYKGIIDHEMLNQLLITIKNTNILILKFSDTHLDTKCLEHIVNATQQNFQLQRIEFDCAKIDNSLLGIHMTIVLFKHQKYFSINLNVGYLEQQAFAKILKAFPNINEIKLAQGSIDHETLNQLLITIKDTKNSLSNLYFGDTNLDNKCVEHIVSAIKQNSQLQVILFYCVTINHSLLDDTVALAFANLLSDNNTLTELTIAQTKITSLGAATIGKALKTNKCLQILCLDHNEVDDDGAIALADMLLINNSLTELLLEHNIIGLKGGAALAKALEKNNKLQTLNLRANNIADSTIEFAKMLKINQSLKNITLADNCITDHYCKQLLQSCSHSKLESLDLEYNELTDKGAKIIVEMMQEEKWPHSLSVDLSSNRMSKTMCNDLNNAIEKYKEKYNPMANGLCIYLSDQQNPEECLRSDFLIDHSASDLLEVNKAEDNNKAPENLKKRLYSNFFIESSESDLSDESEEEEEDDDVVENLNKIVNKNIKK